MQIEARSGIILLKTLICGIFIQNCTFFIQIIQKPYFMAFVVV